MENYNIKIGEIEVDVYGTYREGEKETRTQPEVPSSFDLTRIMYEGIEVSALIAEVNGDFFDKIQTEIISKHED